MAPAKGKSVQVLVGTRKGAFIFRSDLRRKTWKVQSSHFLGLAVHHIIRDPRDGGTLHAATSSAWWGADIQRSHNGGRTWLRTKDGVRFDKDSGLNLTCVWHIRPGRKSEPGVLYAGTDPAGLFRSEDSGETWSEVLGLNRHATRPQWTPGAGGLILHTIIPDPSDAQRLHVAISVAGVFRTDDGGESWQPHNKGTRADFRPDKFPEVGMCVHKMKMAAGGSKLLYQQNHCGVYRSEDGGDSWTDISRGLPSRFGFGLALHPRDPQTLWVLPITSSELRFVPNGCVAAYRSTNGGRAWTKQGRGLPTRHAHVGVLREAMTSDAADPAGVYFGTHTGQLFHTRDEGREWHLLADFLPPILSVETAIV